MHNATKAQSDAEEYRSTFEISSISTGTQLDLRYIYFYKIV